MSYDSSMIHLGDLRSIYFCLGIDITKTGVRFAKKYRYIYRNKWHISSPRLYAT